MTDWRKAGVAGLLVAVSTPAAALPPGFVDLRDVDPTIRQDIRYAGPYNFTGTTAPGYRRPFCILTRSVADALKRVQADARRPGRSLKVYDCYRPMRAVRAFMAWARNPDLRMKAAFYPRVRKRDVVRRGCIAPRSSHATGGSVDVILVRADAPAVSKPVGPAAGSCIAGPAGRPPDNSIDMGTGYDCFDVLSHTAHARLGAAARGNRRLLVRLMARHGFRNYSREWWRFNYLLPVGRRRRDFAVE